MVWQLIILFLILLPGNNVQQSKKLNWEIGDYIFSPGPTGAFDEISVKDPSIVFMKINGIFSTLPEVKMNTQQVMFQLKILNV